MSNSNETSSDDLNSVKTGWVLAILVGIGLVIVGFYFFNFNFHILKNEDWWKFFQNLSADAGNWGTFGDYVGGILNPVIAAFAFYLIAKTYELQKRELEETRKQIKDSIKLEALTASLNTNLTNISILQSEKSTLLDDFITNNEDRKLVSKFYELRYFGQHPESHEYWEEYKELLEEITGKKGEYYFSIIRKVGNVDEEIRELKGNNERLKNKIESFLK